MAQQKFETATVGTSKFTMLRCLVAMAHADGIVTDEERAYISALANRMPLTQEQRSALDRDLVHAQDVGNLFKHINDPNYRSQVLYFARLMAFKDGVLHPSEQQLLDRMHALATDGLDMAAIRAEVQVVVDAKMGQHDIRIDQNRPMKGEHFIPWIQWLDEILLKLGIDLLRD